MSRILLGVSGGIAAYKACELVRLFVQRGHEVRVVATEHALEFVSALTLQTLSGAPVRSQLLAATAESEISHIELADWAQAFVVAPATANVLAKLAHGIADDLLTTIALACTAPLVLAPAMNVNMYRHAATQSNLDVLAKRGARIVGPGKGDLACGWVGEGRLVENEAIAAVTEACTREPTLRGEVVLVSAGPTAEAIDPVRVITNRSSGKMGFALAEAAARRGAEVTLVAGPTALPTPYGVERIDVESAVEMRDAVLGAFERATIVILAAAVADYAPAQALDTKLKREKSDSLSLELVRNPDILAETVKRRSQSPPPDDRVGTLPTRSDDRVGTLPTRSDDRVGTLPTLRKTTIVGFAAETDHVLENARAKLLRKGCDLIVANDVSRGDIGFDVDRNEVVILGPSPDDLREIPAGPKSEIAERILERVLEVRKR